MKRLIWQWSDWEIELLLSLQQLPHDKLRHLGNQVWRSVATRAVSASLLKMQVKKLEDSSSKRSICNTNMSLWRSIFHRHFITFNNFQVLAYSSAVLTVMSQKTWTRIIKMDINEPDFQLSLMLQGCPCKLQPQPLALPMPCAERGVCRRSLCSMNQLLPQLNMPDWFLWSSPSKKSWRKEAGTRHLF